MRGFNWTSSRRWAAPLLAVGALVVTGAVAARYARGTSALSPEGGSIGPDWARESASEFVVELKSGSKLPSSATVFGLELSGRIQLKPLRQEAKRRLVAVVFSQPKVILGGAVGAPETNEAQAIERSLAEPVVAALEDGRVVDAWYAPGTSAVVVSLYRTVLGAMQVSTPKAADASEWSAEEYDSSGRYLATYRRTGSVIERSKSRYVELLFKGRAPADPEHLLPRVGHSSTKLELTDGKLAALHLSEALSSKLEGSAALEFQNELTLRSVPLTATALDRFDERAFVARALHVPAAEPAPGAAPDRSTFDAQRTEGWDFDGLLTELDRLAESPLAPEGNAVAPGQDPRVDPNSPAGTAVQSRTKTFSALTAFLRSKPETIAKVTAKIRGGTTSAKTLLDGLAAAGSPAAQLSLVELMQDTKLDKRLRLRAALGLSTVESPEASAVRAMLAMIGDADMKQQALLGVGSMARRLQDRHEPALEQEVGSRLKQVLDAAATIPERVEALRAISNAGSDQLLPVVRPHLTASEPAVRAAGVEALRHMRATAVDQLMADLLVKDTNADVQMALLRAFQTRGPSSATIAGLSRIIAQSEDAAVRHRAIDVARVWKARAPELRAALERAAQSDADKDVRSAAAAALK